ncbi:MAG: hypothetical protein K6T83_12445, partial [Alicyclobacillus sp.]|nr:hypothetical protein [Alicyclobacillus sp.]
GQRPQVCQIREVGGRIHLDCPLHKLDGVRNTRLYPTSAYHKLCTTPSPECALPSVVETDTYMAKKIGNFPDAYKAVFHYNSWAAMD